MIGHFLTKKEVYFYTIIILFSILYVLSCNWCLPIYWSSLLRLLNISYPPRETRFPTVEMKFNEFVSFFSSANTIGFS